MFLRFLGWVVMLTGVALYFVWGPIPGMIIMGTGVFCTMLSGLISSRAQLKPTHIPVEPLTEESAEKAKEIIRKRAGRPAPAPPASRPSEPSRPD